MRKDSRQLNEVRRTHRIDAPFTSTRAAIFGGQPLRPQDRAGNMRAIAAAHTMSKRSTLEHLASLK